MIHHPKLKHMSKTKAYRGFKYKRNSIWLKPSILIQESSDNLVVSHKGAILPYIRLFWLCEILALLGQNGGKEIMAHINFGSPRV